MTIQQRAENYQAKTYEGQRKCRAHLFEHSSAHPGSPSSLKASACRNLSKKIGLRISSSTRMLGGLFPRLRRASRRKTLEKHSTCSKDSLCSNLRESKHTPGSFTSKGASLQANRVVDYAGHLLRKTAITCAFLMRYPQFSANHLMVVSLGGPS